MFLHLFQLPFVKAHTRVFVCVFLPSSFHLLPCHKFTTFAQYAFSSVLLQPATGRKNLSNQLLRVFLFKIYWYENICNGKLCRINCDTNYFSHFESYVLTKNQSQAVCLWMPSKHNNNNNNEIQRGRWENRKTRRLWGRNIWTIAAA